jgi:LmbE family N-acetylglucosaminyl deacetylase
MAAVDAVYPAARNPMAFPWLAKSGLAAHIVRRLYLFWPNDPNVWVDVSGTVERKIEALRAHASQIHEPDKLETRIREWAGETGAKIGAAGAEAFRLVVIEDDEDEGPTGTTAADAAEASDSREAPGAAVAGDG